MGEIDRISGILLPFIVRTLIIHLIGVEYLGLTGLYYSIVQMLNLTEMGFGTAIVYSMYQPIAENDTPTIRALLFFYVRAYRLVGTVVAVLGLAIMPLLPRFISGPVPTDINIYGLYLIYLANACVSFFVYPERKALLSAHQRDDVSGRVHILTQLAMYLAQAAGIVLTRNYYLYALMMPASSLAYSLLCARRVQALYPDYTCAGTLDPERRRQIRKQVAGLTIRKIAVLSRNALDSVFISAYLGLAMTAIYANYYYIMDSVVMILAVVRTAMAGGVGNSIAMDSRGKNLAAMRRIDFLFMWISGWCAVCLLCLYQPFMQLWVGGTMTLPLRSAALFPVYFYVLKMADIRALYSESAGIWWQARYISVAEAAANLLLNWVMVRQWGLAGILLATLLSYISFNFLGGAVLLFRYYFTDGGLGAYLLSHLRYAAVTGVAAAATFAATTALPVGGVAGFALKAAVCLLLPNAIYLAFYFRSRALAESMPLVLALLKINR